MSYKAAQVNIEDRPLLSRAKESVWTDIGQAEIAYNIFGKAKVRVVRKHDRLRGNVLLSFFIVGMLGLLAWQVSELNLWQTDAVQNAESAEAQKPAMEVIPSAPMVDPASRFPVPIPVHSKANHSASAEHSAVGATDKPQLHQALPPNQVGASAVSHAPAMVNSVDAKPALPDGNSLGQSMAEPIKQ